jgi:hypothetical protein
VVDVGTCADADTVVVFMPECALEKLAELSDDDPLPGIPLDDSTIAPEPEPADKLIAATFDSGAEFGVDGGFMLPARGRRNAPSNPYNTTYMPRRLLIRHTTISAMI